MNGGGAFLVAFGGGIVSFLSPCTLPLLPGYLSWISGLGADEIDSGERTAVLVGTASLFVLGFSLVFAALGATASYIGSALSPYHVLLTRIAGVFVILMALFLLGRWSIPALYTERRLHLSRDFGIWSAFPLGMAFAFGWSPCIGPVLTSIMALAVTENSAQRGALLLFVYGLGLGAPFLLAALFTGRVLSGLSPFKRHYMAIERTGGAILLVMGVFLVMNRWTAVLGPFLNWYSDNVHLPM